MQPLLAPPARGRTGRRLVQSLRVGIGRRMTAARSPHLRFGLIVAALAFLLDQFTKWVVIVPLSLATQPDGRISLAPVFDLQWAENCGISLSMFSRCDDTQRWTLEIGRASCRERVVSTCRSRWSPYH